MSKVNLSTVYKTLLLLFFRQDLMILDLYLASQTVAVHDMKPRTISDRLSQDGWFFASRDGPIPKLELFSLPKATSAASSASSWASA